MEVEACFPPCSLMFLETEEIVKGYSDMKEKAQNWPLPPHDPNFKEQGGQCC